MIATLMSLRLQYNGKTIMNEWSQNKTVMSECNKKDYDETHNKEVKSQHRRGVHVGSLRCKPIFYSCYARERCVES